ncbi:thiamine pyrophosphate-dependent enzyme [Agromyces atrinae]|uniref:thiamine pyrophosphate-dependent enzyme n=1 Tax=Agromyces atrinae TaxID=592376 RepID=UPI001F55D362|nr:thiamine pyrophosphate-dependent enzyme [Agromyces atrinae]MCI2957338.1 thiamine pyrophosphate-dependent enzyme [Agromyces atrinae]
MSDSVRHWRSAASEIHDAGITRVYGLPGDDMAAVGELRRAGIAIVITSEQRTAAYAAAGDAAIPRAAGGTGVGVVVAGRGPGAAALVPPLLELASGGSAVLVLVGGAPEGASERSFQYAPQRAMLAPLSKSYRRLHSGEDAGAIVRAALVEAATAPSGPVVLEIPDAGDGGTSDGGARPPQRPAVVDRPSYDIPLPSVLARSRRPVVLVGAGARESGDEVLRFARLLGAPVICTASGRGIIAEDDPAFWGLSGLYLHPAARRALEQADLLIVAGSRLEETATEHLPRIPVLRIDIEPGPLVGDDETVLIADVSVIDSWTTDAAALGVGRGWGDVVEQVRTALGVWRDEVRSAPDGVAGPHRVGSIMAALADALPKDAVVCHENGAADMWSYLFPVFRLPPDSVDIAPSEQTTLGFGVAAAIGAAHASSRPVVVVCGDGAFSTAAHDRSLAGPGAPRVVYVVFDNGGHGWLALQDRAVTGASGVDFAGLAELAPHDGRGNALASRSIARASDVAAAVEWALAHSGPTVLIVPCTPDESAPVLAEEW